MYCNIFTIRNECITISFKYDIHINKNITLIKKQVLNYLKSPRLCSLTDCWLMIHNSNNKNNKTNCFPYGENRAKSYPLGILRPAPPPQWRIKDNYCFKFISYFFYINYFLGLYELTWMKNYYNYNTQIYIFNKILSLYHIQIYTFNKMLSLHFFQIYTFNKILSLYHIQIYTFNKILSLYLFQIYTFNKILSLYHI